MTDSKSMLINMGFSEAKVEKAIHETGNAGMEEAMEWLLSHTEDEPMLVLTPLPTDVQDSSMEMEEYPNNETREVDNENGELDLQPKSYKCDTCGKVCETEDTMNYHATKSGHTSFSESTEEKKPLTEEQKKEQMRLVEEKLKQKRIEREQLEKKTAIELERRRIQIGKEMAEAKKRMQDEEMKRIVEDRKREKLEEKQARDRVRAQIEADKIARKAKYGGSITTSTESKVEAIPISKVSSTTMPSVGTRTAPKEYAETRLQVRLPNGDTLTQTFGAKEELASVRLFIELNRTDLKAPFNLMTPFPKKVFTTDDYEKPLDILGLVPSAVLIVTKC